MVAIILSVEVKRRSGNENWYWPNLQSRIMTRAIMKIFRLLLVSYFGDQTKVQGQLV